MYQSTHPLNQVNEGLLVTVYHRQTGPARTYRTDADHAVQLHPGEWSWVPWANQLGAAAVPEG